MVDTLNLEVKVCTEMMVIAIQEICNLY